MNRLFVLLLFVAPSVFAQKAKIVTAETGTSVKVLYMKNGSQVDEAIDIGYNAASGGGMGGTSYLRKVVTEMPDTTFVGIDSGFFRFKTNETLLLLENPDYLPRTDLHNFERVKGDKKRVVMKPLQKFPQRQKGEYYLRIEDISVNITPRHFIQKYYDEYPEYTKNEIDHIYTSQRSIEIEHVGFRRGANRMLAKLGYNDTTNSIDLNSFNRIGMKYSIVGVVEHKFNIYCVVEVRINVTFPESFGADRNRYYTARSKIGYDYSVENKMDNENLLQDAVNNIALEILADNRAMNHIRSLTAKNIADQAQFEEITLTASGTQEGIENAAESVVTVIRGAKHGSGCVISNDGYIVTSYHVIGEDTNHVFVQFSNGAKKRARVMRCSQLYDLTVMRIDTTITSPLRIGSTPVNVGAEVFAVGTSNDITLGQSVSKGIVSAKRVFENRQFIQSDASVNKGTTGGALLNRNGELIGIVTSKLVGVGIEGVAFAIPVSYLKEHLKVNTKAQ